MADDDDEYDALLEEPFGQDVDWTAIDGMGDPAAAGAQAAAGSTSERDDYFNDDEVLDESFLNEVRRLENQVMANTPAASAPPPARHPVASPSFENSLSDAGRSTTGLRPRSPRSTLSVTQITLPPSDHLPSSSVLTGDRAQASVFLDPLPVVAAVDPPPSNRLCTPSPSKSSCQASSARKRRRSSGCSSDTVIPRPNAQCNAKQKASRFMEVIEKVLECPICFDIIAASHVFACGHSGCGSCLCEWVRVKGDNTTCCVCRAPHKGPLLPNYTLDDVATSYFNEKNKIRRDGLNYSDKKRWEKRKAEGKAAVQAAAKKPLKRLATTAIPVGPILNYDPDEEDAYEEDLYEDTYYE